MDRHDALGRSSSLKDWMARTRTCFLAGAATGAAIVPGRRGTASDRRGHEPAPPLKERPLVDGHGPPALFYGSEGWGFESLRARWLNLLVMASRSRGLAAFGAPCPYICPYIAWPWQPHVGLNDARTPTGGLGNPDRGRYWPGHGPDPAGVGDLAR
jgi:hypothetical protein